MQKQIERFIVLALCVAVGVLVALQLKSVTNATRRATTDGLTIQDAREQLNDLVTRNQELSERNRELENLLLDIQNESTEFDTQVQYYIEEVRRMATFAGLNDVQGPGAIIQINVTGEKPVSAAELLVILNELRASGVEAISVNDQRLVAMSEVRSLGATGSEIQMNGERLPANEDFAIHVIGEPEKIRGAMDFLTETVARMRIDGKNVTVSYPDLVIVPELSEVSPAYRNNLMEIINQAEDE